MEELRFAKSHNPDIYVVQGDNQVSANFPTPHARVQLQPLLIHVPNLERQPPLICRLSIRFSKVCHNTR